MKNVFIIAMLTAASTVQAHAAPKWLRITSAVAVCGAGAFQGYQASRQNNPNVSIGVNAGACGFAVWNAVRKDTPHSDAFTVLNFGMAGMIGGYGLYQQHTYSPALLPPRRTDASQCLLTPGCGRKRDTFTPHIPDAYKGQQLIPPACTFLAVKCN